MPVIAVENLTKRYGRLIAVNRATFCIDRGEIVGFLGPNGAGKTTTIRMLMGLVRPTSGRRRVLGQTKISRATRKIGAMIEEPSFYPYLSGLDNLRVAAHLYGGVDQRRIAEVLALVGLLGRERDRVSQYSQGMRQRLGLARALLPRPELLILDEPTNGLDPEGITEVRDTIKQLGESGITIFLSSHLLAEVERIARRVIIIEQGKILVDGPVEELKKKLAGGKVVVQLEVGDPARVVSLLAQQSWALHPALNHDGVRVAIGVEDVGRIAPLLVAAGVELRELRRSTSLEDLYLQTIKEGRQ